MMERCRRAAPERALAQWAHDIRNALATAALHLEMIEHTCDSKVEKALTRAQASLAKASALCAGAMEDAGTDAYIRPRRFDVTTTIAQVYELVAPVVPAPTTLHVVADGPFYVMADPQDVFRILFNLLHNAMTAARRRQGMRRIELFVEAAPELVIITIADDGPGLPQSVRSRLFRPQAAGSAAGNGHGLAIARELAERNGAVLELLEAPTGTAFTIELPAAGVVRSAFSRTERAETRVSMQA